MMMIELITWKVKKKCIRILLKLMILISKLYTHMNNIKKLKFTINGLVIKLKYKHVNIYAIYMRQICSRIILKCILMMHSISQGILRYRIPRHICIWFQYWDFYTIYMEIFLWNFIYSHKYTYIYKHIPP